MTFTKAVVATFSLLLLLAPAGVKGELVNPGFEKVRTVGEKEGYIKGLKNAGWKFDEPLLFPEGWRTNSGAFRNGEYRLLSGKGIPNSGKNCIYLKGHLMHSKAIDVTAGDEVSISFYVKDPKQKSAAVNLYFYYRDEKNKNRFTGSALFTVKTGPDWTRQSGVIKIPEESSDGKRVNAVILALVSSTGAYFDDVEMVHKRTSAWLNFDDAYTEGNKKLKEGNCKEARDDFNAALNLTEVSEKRIKTFLRIAESYLKEKDYGKAIETFGIILDKEKTDDKTRADLLFRTADAYLALKNYPKTREVLEEILREEKIDGSLKVDAMHRISDTHIKERNPGQAIEALRKILLMKEANPIEKVSVQLRIGDTYYSQANYQKARDAFGKVLLMPATTFVDRFDANRKTGYTYAKEKNYEKAREAYKNALNVDDVNPYSKANLLAFIAGTYESEGRYKEAISAYEKVFDMGSAFFRNKRNAYIKIGGIYRKQGNYIKERENYVEMSDWARRDVPAWAFNQIPDTRMDMYRLTGDSYWAEGNKKRAEEYYLLFLEGDRMVKLRENLIREVEAKTGVNMPAAHIRKARTLFFERSYDEAKSEYEKALETDGITGRQKAVVHLGMGDICLAREYFDKAREEFGKAAAMKDIPASEKVKALMLTGDSYSIEQNYQQARNEYEKVSGIKDAGLPEKIDALRKIAETYRAQCDYSHAKEKYLKILAMEGLDSSMRDEIEQRIWTIYR